MWLDLAVWRQVGLSPDKLELMRRRRDQVATRMTSAEIEDARRRAAAWVPTPR